MNLQQELLREPYFESRSLENFFMLADAFIFMQCNKSKLLIILQSTAERQSGRWWGSGLDRAPCAEESHCRHMEQTPSNIILNQGENIHWKQQDVQKQSTGEKEEVLRNSSSCPGHADLQAWRRSWIRVGLPSKTEFAQSWTHAAANPWCMEPSSLPAPISISSHTEVARSCV